MTSQQIEEILSQVRAQIAIRRETGQFPPGYEVDVEEAHNLQLGKVRSAELLDTEKLLERLEQVRAEMSKIVETPPDQSRFRIVRIVRDSAAVRHDLRQTKKQMMSLNESLDALISKLVAGVLTAENEKDFVAMVLFHQVLDRTLLLDQFVVLCNDMEKRIQRLEQNK